MKLPSGEGAPVPGALEDGSLDALPAARGVAAGLASRHGWMLNLLGDLVAWAAIAIAIAVAIAVQTGRGDRSNKGRVGGGKGFGGRGGAGVQARARGAVQISELLAVAGGGKAPHPKAKQIANPRWNWKSTALGAQSNPSGKPRSDGPDERGFFVLAPTKVAVPLFSGCSPSPTSKSNISRSLIKKNKK